MGRREWGDGSGETEVPARRIAPALSPTSTQTAPRAAPFVLPSPVSRPPYCTAAGLGRDAEFPSAIPARYISVPTRAIFS